MGERLECCSVTSNLAHNAGIVGKLMRIVRENS